MRDWKKAFGQPDDEFTLRVQQTLLAIEEKEEEPVKKKMTLSLAFACILFATILAVSAFAASNILGGRPDETLQPLSQGDGDAPERTAAPTVMPMPTTLPTPMPMEPTPYWTTPYANYYHVDEHCSGMENAQRVSFEAAVNMGKQPCPLCVVEYFRALEMDAATEAEQAAGATLPPEPLPEASYDGAAGDGIALMTDFNQPLRAGEPRAWGIDLTDPNREDFNAGSEPLNGEHNGSWTNDVLTVHNVVFVRTRSALFMEFEYSMNDATISPWSIRITPLVGETPLGWHDARVHEATSADNTTRYLLSIVMDSPADEIGNTWYLYGGVAAEERRALGMLGSVEDQG